MKILALIALILTSYLIAYDLFESNENKAGTAIEIKKPVALKVTPKELEKLIDIAAIEAMDSDEFAMEYKEARVYYQVDINDDGIDDFVVFYINYNYGGGTNSSTFAAIIFGVEKVSQTVHNWFKIGHKHNPVDFDFLEIHDSKLRIRKNDYDIGGKGIHYEDFDVNTKKRILQ